MEAAQMIRVSEGLFSVAFLVFSYFLIYLFNLLWLNPRRLRSMLTRQGIKGPPPSFLLGNLSEMKRIQSKLVKVPLKAGEVSHDWSSVNPFFHQWTIQYGSNFIFSIMNIQILHVSDYDMVKEISLCTSLDLGKPLYQQKNLRALLGQGIMTSNGQAWAYQKKIIGPELHMRKVKGMVNVMAECAASLVGSWESKIEEGGGVADIRIEEYLRIFSADVISKACFGSSYLKGQHIFKKLVSLQQVMSKNAFFMGIRALNYLPTKNNREIWRLEKEIHSLILKVVREREQGTFDHKDLLQAIINGAKNGDLGPNSADNFIVDNCKNIFLAGHGTTAISICWALLLLASNPDWQTRVRDEVLQVCGGRAPDHDMFDKLKLLTMVIQESMRLYPSGGITSRAVLKDMKFGNIHVPKGVTIWIPTIALHRDPSEWGQDVDSFKPERFANGPSAACKHPQIYQPFGVGPRICVGQSLAWVESKTILSLLLSKFSFSVSPNYCHSPVMKFIIGPEHGVNLLVKRIN